MRAALLASALLSGACLVDLPDDSGLGCDGAHPCGPGRQCVAGVCRGEGQGGGASGAGQPLWRQRLDGFDSEQVLSMGALRVLADAGNQVIASVAAADGTDRATAIESDPASLPSTGHGHLKGRFRLPAPLQLSGTSTFLRLELGSNALVQLQLNAAGQLVVRTDPGFIGPVAYTRTVTWAGGFQPNVDYTVDVSWKRGQFRQVYLNGSKVDEVTASSPGGGLMTPNQLRLGVYRYDGDGGAGFSVSLVDWAIADQPGVPL